MGLALASCALPMTNRLFWREDNEQRSISSWGTFLLLIPGLILSFFAVASQSWLTLYPVALLSTAGLVTVLSSVNRHPQIAGDLQEMPQRALGVNNFLCRVLKIKGDVGRTAESDGDLF